MLSPDLLAHVVGALERTVLQKMVPAPLLVLAAALVGVIHIEKRQVVAVNMRELDLGLVCLARLAPRENHEEKKKGKKKEKRKRKKEERKKGKKEEGEIVEKDKQNKKTQKPCHL
jgi:hypothetical protein